jgi:hypothetical protein
MNKNDTNTMNESELKDVQKENLLPYEVKTFLPCFQGYYETNIGNLTNNLTDMDYMLNDASNLKSQFREYFIDNELKYVDDSKYHNDVSIDIVDYWNEKIVEDDNLHGKLSFTFYKLNSPKYYNYTTDIIEIDASYNDDLLEFLKGYCNKYKSQFTEYLENKFKSRDGFSSFYEYDFDTWILYLNKDTFIDDDSFNKSNDSLALNDFNVLGSFLDFYFKNEENQHKSNSCNDIQNDLYEYIHNIYCCNDKLDNYFDYDKQLKDLNIFYLNSYVLKEIELNNQQLQDNAEVFEGELFKLKLENNINFDTVMELFNKMELKYIDITEIEDLEDSRLYNQA